MTCFPGVQSGNVAQFEKSFSEIHLPDDKSVVVAFQDGTQVSGNLVIGCDGSRSGVRGFLVGAEAAKLEDLPLTMINYAGGSYTAEQARQLTAYHPIVKLARHPDLPGGALLAGKSRSSHRLTMLVSAATFGIALLRADISKQH